MVGTNQLTLALNSQYSYICATEPCVRVDRSDGKDKTGKEETGQFIKNLIPAN